MKQAVASCGLKKKQSSQLVPTRLNGQRHKNHGWIQLRHDKSRRRDGEKRPARFNNL